VSARNKNAPDNVFKAIQESIHRIIRTSWLSFNHNDFCNNSIQHFFLQKVLKNFFFYSFNVIGVFITMTGACYGKSTYKKD
jgi:hypothetical protein